jgi:inorganic pyrophosphatase
MMESTASGYFWEHLDLLVISQPLVIDRPRGSHHPRFQEIIYPLDYGYLEGTISGDGGGIDVWLGASGTRHLSAVILTVDLHKRDTEIKFLLGCSEQEIQTILSFHNDSDMRATLVRRPTDPGDAK